MNINNWKIFDKKGSPLNLFADSHLNLTFVSANGKNAEGYLLTDISGNINSSHISNSGFSYTTDTSILYNDIFNETLIDITGNVNINYVDVSIFTNEIGQNVQGIGSIDNIDVSSLYEYPSTIYTGAVFLEPVSQGIVETEHLFILEQIDSSFYRPYDSSITSLLFEMYGEDDEIKLFSVNEDENSVVWTDSLIYDVSVFTENTPISINIGFRAESEGVFERKLRIYANVEDEYYTLGEIIVNAESIGEDERFRTLLSNFGLPDPKDFPTLFKESDINEDLPDYQIVNPKSKQMILDQNEIIPYIGTYKALVNAIKWLGYDDIYIREWFKNVQENKKLSLVIPYNAKDYIDPSTGLMTPGRNSTILSFSPEDRKVLKKLNQLSLNYCLTKETGEYDTWGTPETENCYDYNINEVFVKLLSLKNWLEKNIIGVNARIIDVTGEGVYFDRFKNQIYATDNIGYTYKQSQSLTPISIGTSELYAGEASIYLTIAELSQTQISDLNVSFKDYVSYVWNPLDPSNTLSIDSSHYLENPDNFLLMGPTMANPMISLNDIQWKASIENTKSGVLSDEYVSNPLWIYDNEIRYYNIMDSSSVFNDSSTHVSVSLETAYLRDPNIDEWDKSIAYSIYPDIYLRIGSLDSEYIFQAGDYSIVSGDGSIVINDKTLSYVNTSELFPYNFTVTEDATIITSTQTKIISPNIYGYVMESSLGVIYKFDNYVYFNGASTNSVLQYALDSNYNVPLMMMQNFETYDTSGNLVSFPTNKTYYLDILDGKIAMNSNSSQLSYINFNYDTSLYEQQITLNVEYISPRMPLQLIDPSIYYWADPSGLSGGDSNSLLIDNSIYVMNVNHIGDYNIEVFGWDSYNTLFTNQTREDHNVWIKHPTIYTLIDSSDNINKLLPKTEYLTIGQVDALINDNKKPIYDRQVPLQGLYIDFTVDGQAYIKVPSITYFQDIPQPKSINKFFNLTERVIDVSGNDLVIDPDYQKFFIDDSIKLLFFDKSNYLIIDEIDTSINTLLGNDITVDNIPAEYIVDSSYGVYLLNDTYRSTSNYVEGSGEFTIDISMSGYSYENNQLIGLIIQDTISGYSWGSSFRVNENPIGSTHKFDFGLPDYVVNNLSRYKISAKHAFSAFSTFSGITNYANEENNNFIVYLEDDYRQLLLDNTFVMINILFDHNYVNNQWYDPSDNLVNSNYYYYDETITIDISTLVILQSKYDDDNYLLNQKNVWTIRENATQDIIMKVFNDSVPFIFDVSGYYDVIVDSYDSYGNLSITTYEGLIKIV